MSDHEDHSFSPANGSNNALGGRQNLHQQNHQDSRGSQPDSQSSNIKSSQVNGASQASSNFTSRTSDNELSPSHLPVRQPINDAVSSAVHTTYDNVSPDFIQLITQTVIQQLQNHQTTGVGAQPAQLPTNRPLDGPDTASSSSGSPIFDRQPVYTPPELHPGEDLIQDVRALPTMPAIPQINMSSYEKLNKRDVSPAKRGGSDSNPGSDSELKPPRPVPLRRASTDGDATVVEKIWGKLFDEQGQSTARLSQFLRGIAVHLIEDYEPKYSLVVTPDKMQQYYADTELTEHTELYPWKHVFDDKTSSLSRLFREPDIKVQHHLVQESLDARPEIPGLTPHGFATWMLLILKAHPDHEFERLTKTLKEMPIDNPDNKRERFPKELSRRQFPASGSQAISVRLVELMAVHCKVHLKSRNNSTIDTEPNSGPSSPRIVPPRPRVEDAADEHESFYPAPLQPTSTRSSVSTAGQVESKVRGTGPQRAPSMAPSETSIEEDSSDVPTPQPRPIERERKPYVAQVGQGKVHDVYTSGDDKPSYTLTPTDDMHKRRTKSISGQPRPRIPPPIAIHQQSDAAPVQTDGVDLSRYYTIPGTSDNSSRPRAQSNSSYGDEGASSRRGRSNSVYTNENGQRYHAKRSPTFSKTTDYPRASAPNTSNYTTYPPPPMSTSSVAYPHTQPPQDNRHRDLPGGEPRYPRYRDSSREPDLNSPEEYFRMNGPMSMNGAGPYQYPPTSYRDR